MPGTHAKHSLNKERFLEEMKARGWKFDDAHGWLAPEVQGLTKRVMEQHWVESIVASIDCPHEQAEVRETLGDA